MVPGWQPTGVPVESTEQREGTFNRVRRWHRVEAGMAPGTGLVQPPALGTGWLGHGSRCRLDGTPRDSPNRGAIGAGFAHRQLWAGCQLHSGVLEPEWRASSISSHQRPRGSRCHPGRQVWPGSRTSEDEQRGHTPFRSVRAEWHAGELHPVRPEQQDSHAGTCSRRQAARRDPSSARRGRTHWRTSRSGRRTAGISSSACRGKPGSAR